MSHDDFVAEAQRLGGIVLLCIAIWALTGMGYFWPEDVRESASPLFAGSLHSAARGCRNTALCSLVASPVGSAPMWVMLGLAFPIGATARRVYGSGRGDREPE